MRNRGEMRRWSGLAVALGVGLAGSLGACGDSSDGASGTGGAGASGDMVMDPITGGGGAPAPKTCAHDGECPPGVFCVFEQPGQPGVCGIDHGPAPDADAGSDPHADGGS